MMYLVRVSGCCALPASWLPSRRQRRGDSDRTSGPRQASALSTRPASAPSFFHPLVSLISAAVTFLKDTLLLPLWSWRSKPRTAVLSCPLFVSIFPWLHRRKNADKTSFFQVPQLLPVIMPRRPAPSPLRLCPSGPVPRGTPKFVMPSIPLPTFQPVSVLPSTSIFTSSRRRTDRGLPPLDIFQDPIHREHHQVYGHMPTGSTSSVSSISPTSSWDSKCPSPVNAQIRAPWNHSGPMGTKLDFTNVLAPLKPVAISP